MVRFEGRAPHSRVVEFYQKSDLFLNPSQTGSLDKTVLESMASGCLVLTANPAYKGLLPERYFFENNDLGKLVEKIIAIKGLNIEERAREGIFLREIVVKNHSLDHWASQVIAELGMGNQNPRIKN